MFDDRITRSNQRHGALPLYYHREVTAIWLGRYFGTDSRLRLNLQAARDLSKAEKTYGYKKIAPGKVA